MSRRFRHKISFYLYIAFWLLYLMQQAFFGEKAAFSGALLAILLIWSAYHFFCTIRNRMPMPLQMLSVLLGSYVLYGIFPIINNEVLYVLSYRAVAPYYYMVRALMSILPVYVFYHYAKKGIIDFKEIRFLFIIFFTFIIFDYYDSQTRLLVSAMQRGISHREFTNNIGYSFLYLFPYLYFIRRKYALLFMMCIVIFLILAMKRGAILIGIVCVTLYLYNWLKFAKRQTKIDALVGILIVIVCIGVFVIDVYQNSNYFQSRVEQTIEGDTSGRDKIATQLMDVYINKSEISQQMLGHGANATLKHSINYAHNDWLEMLFNQGFVGVSILFLFYVSLFLFIRRIRQYNEIYNVFLTLFIILFSQTLFSMSICNMRPYTTLLLGFFLAKTSTKDAMIQS